MAVGRVMIAATGSGSGKTTISCALMKALKSRGLVVAPYKCGPDYIDPMYHRIALDLGMQAMNLNGETAPGGNLDTFFTDAGKTVEIFYEGGYGDSDISVIEGVMGLYDGLGGTSITGSSYELAAVLKTPIILVIPAKGVGRSVLATIRGFLDYDEHKLIRGVILNRISGMYYTKLKKLIEDELDIRVVGYVPEDDRLHIGSRHLGLMTPTADDTYMTYVSQTIDAACEIINDTVDIDSLIEIAGATEQLDMPKCVAGGEESRASCLTATHTCAPFADKKISKMAVAMDEAFCFYYRENLRYLKALGIKLVPFSPLHDDKLPEGVDAVLIGGGYPEEYLSELSANVSMKDAIKKASDEGIYIIAECGGFMYLQESIEDKEGRPYAMTGVLSGVCKWQGKLTRFGYVRLNMDDHEIKGHEFHYYDSDHNGEDIEVIKASTGKSYRVMYANDKVLAGFAHLYYPSYYYKSKNDISK